MVARSGRKTTIIVYWGYIGIMEKKMETIGITGVILRYILGLYRDSGGESGNYHLEFEFRGF